MKTGYELEMAYRKMDDYQRRAQKDSIVKEFKETREEQNPSLWRRLLNFFFNKPDQIPINTPVKPAFDLDSPSKAMKTTK